MYGQEYGLPWMMHWWNIFPFIRKKTISFTRLKQKIYNKRVCNFVISLQNNVVDFNKDQFKLLSKNVYFEALEVFFFD